MRRLKSLVPSLAPHMPSSHQNKQDSTKMQRLQMRWSAERFADEDDPDASVKHMEMAWS